jgi:4'-phosphopantetheinyl transferase
MLSPDELTRAERFHFSRDRDRFIARRGLLRELLGFQLQMAPGHLEFSAGLYGKLALVAPCHAQPLHFSLAHSQDIAVFALSRSSEIGVDVEVLRQLPDLADLISTVFSSREKVQWQSIPESEREQAFFDVWTRKEAFVKGTGDGLQAILTTLEVPLAHCGPGRQLPVFIRGRRVPHWSLRSFSIERCALALALRHPPTRICAWEWQSDGN